MVRYIAIVKEEGLEISQPALDPGKSEIYHPLTARIQGSKVHRLTSTSLLSIIEPMHCSTNQLDYYFVPCQLVGYILEYMCTQL